MSFQFIDNSAIDCRSRKLIRSHVMRGINKGKTISRPSKKHLSRGKATPATTCTGSDQSNTVNLSAADLISEPSLASVALPVGHRFSSVRLPIEPGPYARKRLTQFFHLIGDSLYPPEFCHHQDHATTVWFQYVSTDAAFLHCTIAICASFFDLFSRNQQAIARSDIPPEALEHIAHAFRLTNERLASKDALADNTMASVVSLSLHEQLLRDYATGRIHLAGLAKIVGLRGGLLQLPRQLAQKICRCDIDVALHDGTPPLLHYPGVSGDQVYAVFGSRRTHSRLAELLPNAALDCIATDISTVADFLNSENKHRKLDSVTYQDMVIDLGYRLVEYTPPRGRPQAQNTLQAALHLALTAFITTFILQFGHQRRIRFDHLSLRFRDALQGPWTRERENASFLLWALVIGGISEFGWADYGWLLPGLRQTAKTLDISGWEGLQRTLIQYPWVRLLHDDPARKLWESALSV